MPGSPDWHQALAHHLATVGHELSLAQLQPGDVLRVRTQNTRYELTIIRDRDALLRTDRLDRPSGRVRINGCAFGAGTTIKSDYLFSGGCLEFAAPSSALTHRTTAIRDITLLHRSNPTDSGVIHST